jgi:CelD/BcsL family acetyltransferase involved in cellulose biosynthesis
MRAEPFATQIVLDEAMFRALAPQWWELWRRSPSATPFQTPAWLLAWWRHFAPGGLNTLVVRQDSRLVGLAPFYRELGQAGARLRPIGISLSDYLDVLVDPSCGGDAAALLVDVGQELCWRSWDFEELSPEASVWRLRCPATAYSVMVRQSTCPVLRLDCDDDLAGAVPSRRRRQLRRAVAAARRRGRMEIYPATDSPQDFLDHLFRLHRACWKDRGEKGVLSDNAVQDFHLGALPELAAAGLARCYLLQIGGTVAAAYYGFLDRGRAYAYLGGFDPDFAYESPGSILIGHAIAEAVREGAREFHFLRGGETYKYSWGAVDRWNRRRSFNREGDYG